MPDPLPIILLLAAGRGERFAAAGGISHKLDATLAGETILDRSLRNVEESGLPWLLVRPEGGTSGMGASIAFGVQETADASGWLILPADLPLVRPESLRRVAAALTESVVVVPSYRFTKGHPVGFRRECFAALCALDGDRGAAPIVQAHRKTGDVRDLSVNDPGIVCDIDVPDDLLRAARVLNGRGRASGRTFIHRRPDLPIPIPQEN